MKGELPPELLRFFDALMKLLSEHERYGPALREAASDGARLALDYHSHGEGEGYCVSVRTCRGEGEEAILDPVSEELAHVQGFGRTAEDCEPLLALLAARLMSDFGFEEVPLPYFQGNTFQGFQN
ncbi:MAG: hypothetical protein AAF368_00755 [Planctomycetota bacterium]